MQGGVSAWLWQLSRIRVWLSQGHQGVQANPTILAGL